MTANPLTEAYYRRLYSFHEPTEEFYSKTEPRDKDGKWTRGGKRAGDMPPTGPKVWSGLSPTPTNRVVPTNTLRHDPFDQMGSGTMESLARRLYDADLGGGYHSRVVESSPGYDNSMYVRGYIYKGKNQVGAFERTLINGKALVVSHDELNINPSHQGKGLGDRFNAHAVAEYQQLGVDRIILHAAEEVGGYAWARQGFRFNEDEGAGQRQKFLNERLDRIDVFIKYNPTLRDHKAELTRQVKAMRKAIDAGDDVQPIHIAALGEKFKYKMYDDNSNEYTTWPGKSALLGSRWSGVYFLNAGSPVTAAASDIEHGRLRVVTEEFFARDPEVVQADYSRAARFMWMGDDIEAVE